MKVDTRLFTKEIQARVGTYKSAHSGTKKIKGELKMFGEMFKRFGGCHTGCKPLFCGLNFGKNSSCEVLWIIILLLIVLKGGLFGLDICTIIILFIIFGKDFLCCEKREPKCC